MTALRRWPQSQAQAEPAFAPQIVHEVLRSPGQPLDDQTRAFFEPRFGHDFSHVRLHTDARAAEAADAVGALAFSVGPHIAFAGGHYQPGTQPGRELLAHELTHVLQQPVRDVPATLPVAAAGSELESVAGSISRALLQPGPAGDDAAAMPPSGSPWSPGPAAWAPDAQGRCVQLMRQMAAPAPGSSPQTAVLSPWTGLLRGGPLSWLVVDILLYELFGTDGALALADAIRADPAAVAYVREPIALGGASAVVALADTRLADGRFDVDAARRHAVHLPWPVLEARAARLTSRRAREAEARELAGVQTWAETEKARQGVVSTAAVVGLAPKPASTLKALRGKLPVLGAAGPAAAVILDEVAHGLARLVDGDREGSLRHALPRLRSDDRLRQLEGQVSVRRAEAALEELLRRMPEALALAEEAEPLAFALDDQLRALRGATHAAPAGARSVDVDAVEQVRSDLRDVRQRFATTANELRQGQASPARLDFVLRCLLWLNGTPGATAPTPAEARQLAGLLRGELGDDLHRLFPSLEAGQLELLRTFGEQILPRQLEARRAMQANAKAPAGTVPSAGEAMAWFRSMRRRSNADVNAAYQGFAEAWFYHREVAALADLVNPTMPGLFAREASITGQRPLVCSGYALLGATLLHEAGASLQHYVLAVRATDEQIRAQRIDAGHAVAVLARGGKRLIVSNHLVVDNENDAIGPEAVAWAHAKAPLHSAAGKTLAQAKRRLEAELSRILNRP